jgi:hypothetical protein
MTIGTTGLTLVLLSLGAVSASAQRPAAKAEGASTAAHAPESKDEEHKASDDADAAKRPVKRPTLAIAVANIQKRMAEVSKEPRTTRAAPTPQFQAAVGGRQAVHLEWRETLVWPIDLESAGDVNSLSGEPHIALVWR